MSRKDLELDILFDIFIKNLVNSTYIDQFVKYRNLGKCLQCQYIQKTYKTVNLIMITQ